MIFSGVLLEITTRSAISWRLLLLGLELARCRTLSATTQARSGRRASPATVLREPGCGNLDLGFFCCVGDILVRFEPVAGSGTGFLYGPDSGRSAGMPVSPGVDGSFTSRFGSLTLLRTRSTGSPAWT